MELYLKNHVSIRIIYLYLPLILLMITKNCYFVVVGFHHDTRNPSSPWLPYHSTL